MKAMQNLFRKFKQALSLIHTFTLRTNNNYKHDEKHLWLLDLQLF